MQNDIGPTPSKAADDIISLNLSIKSLDAKNKTLFMKIKE